MNCPHCANGVVSVDDNDMIVLSACTECSGYGVIEKSLQVSTDSSDDLVAVPFTDLPIDHTRPISHAEWLAGYREWKAKTHS
jgi:hypothetical protein